MSDDSYSLRDQIAAACQQDDAARRACDEWQGRQLVHKSYDGRGLVYKTTTSEPPPASFQSEADDVSTDELLVDIVAAIERGEAALAASDARAARQERRINKLIRQVGRLRAIIEGGNVEPLGKRGRDAAVA
jgi:hypothetical protein